MSRTTIKILASLAFVFIAPLAHAGTVQFNLGEQDFADGKTPVYSREIKFAGAGEAYPFDGTIFGHDLKSSLGSFEYVHTFKLNEARPLAATLRVGLIDIDSPPDAPRDTLSILLDGVVQPTNQFMGISKSGPSSAEVIDIPIPIELLIDGSLHVSIAAKQAGYRSVGNAIEPDFSSLIIETVHGAVVPPILDPDFFPSPGPDIDPNPEPVPAVPLPPALIPAGMMLAGLAAAPKRRLRQWLRV
jgi:hypothetical protein